MLADESFDLGLSLPQDAGPESQVLRCVQCSHFALQSKSKSHPTMAFRFLVTLSGGQSHHAISSSA